MATESSAVEQTRTAILQRVEAGIAEGPFSAEWDSLVHTTGARTLCRRERSLLGLSELCRRTSGSAIVNRFGGKIT